MLFGFMEAPLLSKGTRYSQKSQAGPDTFLKKKKNIFEKELTRNT